MITVVSKSITEATEKYIAHQCNCITNRSAGAAKAIFDTFPHADVYTARSEPDTLGTIKIMGDGQDYRHVINMFAQYYPGKPKHPASPMDGTAARQRHFYNCLLRIALIPKLESIAFPYGIGCNLGGGNWTYYSGVLGNFAKYVYENHGTKVSLYHD